MSNKTAAAKTSKIKKTKERKLRGSLGRKTFFITLLMTLSIGLTVLVAGCLLYFYGVTHEFYISTWNQANAEAAVLEQTDYRSKCDEIIELYEALPEEMRAQEESEESSGPLIATRDDNFTEIQKAMHSLQNRNGPLNSFIVAIDDKHDRVIYLIDADQDEETTCLPGTWDAYPHDQIDILINGARLSKLERRQGITRRIQSTFTNHHQYGPRCTAGSTLYTTERYTVMVCVDEKLGPVLEIGRIFLTRYIGLLVGVTLIASMIGMALMRKALVNPINRMSKAAKAYGRGSKKNEDKRYFADLGIKTGDELERLAVTLQGMEEDVDVYMEDLTHATAEKERINTELSLAARIQGSMLMRTFPPFPDKTEFDIYASMEPAKVIGGDFYDMILIDDDHLAVEIADVSGKGIPAALFMMSSKILLAEGVRNNLSPAEILEKVNEQISQNNQEEMFVTVWLGILELSTGKLTASNAGHEYPVMIYADGTVEMLKDKHGFVIGGMTGMKYTDYELQLNKGDRILVYTDGVTEAISTDDELFGTGRILDACRTVEREAGPRDIMSAVREHIREFTEGSFQYDDLTMLCLQYLGK